MTRCTFAAVLFLAVLPSVASAQVEDVIGPFEFFLNSVIIPDRNTETFQEPPPSHIESWKNAIALLIAGNLNEADRVADDLGYRLIRYHDLIGGQVFYVFLEEVQDSRPLRGLGTFVLNPRWSRLLNIQSPHPENDSRTRLISIAMFLQLDAAFLQIAGTHRCANAERSPCSGTTSNCRRDDDPDRIPYRESDVAHFVDNFYQAASDEVAVHFSGLVSVSVHGFSTPRGNDPLQTSIVQISNGTTGEFADSLSTQLASTYNSILFNLNPPYPGQGAASFNLASGEREDLQFRGAPAQPGGSNTQGRALNESPDPCRDGVSRAPAPERFIHLEQQHVIREDPPGQSHPGVSYQVTIDVFAFVFGPKPPIWVDFAHDGPEIGDFDFPFNTLAEGVQAALPGQMIRIKAGQTTEPIVIRQPVRIKSFGGPVRIQG